MKSDATRQGLKTAIRGQSEVDGSVSTASDEILDPIEAAAHAKVTPSTLASWRCTKRHSIPYIKVGRLVRYRKSDLDAWLESRKIGAEVEL